MHLLTFAHYPEAAAFVANFDCHKHAQHTWIFCQKNVIIAITGEGLYEAGMRTSLCLGLFPQIDSVLNFGVAGALDRDLELHSSVCVRTVYGFDQKPLFKSFQAHGQIDLVSCSQRVLNPEDAAPLKTMARLVDREAWAVAYAAKNAGKDFYCFKYLSDVAGELNACEPVKELAHQASGKLLERYLNLSSPPQELPKLAIEGFHFTFTQQNEVLKLIQKLCIKFQNTQNDWLQHPVIKELQQKELLPKQRTKEFSGFLKRTLDPFAYRKQQFFDDHFSALRTNQIEITALASEDTPNLKLQFVFDNESALKQKLQIISSFNFEPYYRFWRGERHD